MYVEVKEIKKTYWMIILDNFKRVLFCINIFCARRYIDILDPETKPGSGVQIIYFLNHNPLTRPPREENPIETSGNYCLSQKENVTFFTLVILYS